MKKTRSILMVVLMLVVALSLSGCTLFGNKDKDVQEANAIAATKGVIAAINDENNETKLSDYMNTEFKVNINVKFNGNNIEIIKNKKYQIDKIEEIEELFQLIRTNLIYNYSGNFNSLYIDLNNENNKIIVNVGSGISANTILSTCTFGVVINGKDITSGNITFTMNSDSKNKVHITQIDINIDVLPDQPSEV